MARQATRWIAVAILFIAAASAAAAEPKRVLLVHSYGRGFSPYDDYVAKFRAELGRQSPDPIDFYEVSVETARFTEGKEEAAFVDYANALFASRRLDLAVTIGAPAAGFVERHRDRLLASTHVLFSAVDQQRLNYAAVTDNDAVVASRIDRSAIIENILTVLPQTNRIAVVTGASPLEKTWLGQMRQDFQPFSNRIEFTWLNDLPLKAILKELAALPPHSAIYFGLFSVDAAGVPHEAGNALTAIHAVANAPMFSYVDAHFGRGIVGGPMISLDDLSRQAAAAAVRLLRGDPPQEVKAPVIGLAAPLFDWRELRRWGIDEASLPAGSSVQFRSATVWQRYKWYILGAVAFCGLQALFIIMLANWQRLRRVEAERRQVEAAAHELSGRLINAAEQERARLARELHDDVTQRLALLAIDAGREERNSAGGARSATMKAMREGLIRLSEDVHALSYRLHPSLLEDLGLIEALKSECDSFSRTCPTRLDASTQDVPERLPQDVALCLFRIAQEGLRNVGRHAKATRAEVRLHRLDGGLELVIKDDGTGFDAARHRNGTSLGLASMRQRAFLLGGKVKIDSSPGRGAVVTAWVPLKEEQSGATARAAG